MKLIVGLGNPGKEYAHTRHNAGFIWVNCLADTLKVTLNLEARFHGLCARINAEAADFWLLEPQTYMNRSGQSVAALCRFYKIQPDEIVVVHDELDLLPGSAKLKWGGGLGGHNGLKDIAAQLGTRDFWRLRIGIGHPGDRNAVVRYVLRPPGKEDALLINQAIERSLQIWPMIAQDDFQSAMLKLHTK
ncbi:peptidyl-tRNA hydrolase, PTH1 family [Nitrosomonas sp. Nm51]|uniref:aminoacyl-tRNA hydrolase n=1 Tax=Nitrosomonas sp. Nm51 TaxID=133720 RepID=UPI0008C6224C|nr:aminoacyl-tRNA hydrolase [Nitrosomonas sp. Nm51]SER57408.1 peptidyl-tRNA hydrolase, PTH1 family [Nitrosomonas sp. Nm51]